MQFRLNIKPTKVTAPTNSSLLTIISRGHMYTFSNKGNYYTSLNRNKDMIRVYSLQKLRRKVKREGKNTVVIRKAYWIGHYYDIPIALIDAFKITINQHHRHFTIKSK